jgi:hypothetical protein
MSCAALCATLMLLNPVAKTIKAPSNALPSKDMASEDARARGTAVEARDEVLMISPWTVGTGLNTDNNKA